MMQIKIFHVMHGAQPGTDAVKEANAWLAANPKVKVISFSHTSWLLQEWRGDPFSKVELLVEVPE